ncbi:MAG: M91 family zinc metallopeptidase, partial [Niastella sp.]|uniref:M91 family zinc metallopeptidase n=1 Tax=Niastella sp. TaxID=1869183 RepID=UPI00389B11BE
KTHKVEIAYKSKGKKNEGTALVRNLIGNSKTLTINMALAVEKGEVHGMPGAATGATKGDKSNESNGRGTDISTDVGAGHTIYTKSSGGTIREERLSVSDMLDHELVHAFAQMNGEEIADGTMKHSYEVPDGTTRKETISKEEGATVGFSIRQSSKGIKYTTENNLRFEQGKTERLNYYEY